MDQLSVTTFQVRGDGSSDQSGGEKDRRVHIFVRLLGNEISRGQRFSGCLLHLCPVSQMDGYEVH